MASGDRDGSGVRKKRRRQEEEAWRALPTATAILTPADFPDDPSSRPFASFSSFSSAGSSALSLDSADARLSNTASSRFTRGVRFIAEGKLALARCE